MPYNKLSVDSIHVGRYKDGYGKPLYSFDLRHQSPGGEGVLWASEDGGATPRAQLSVRSELQILPFLHSTTSKLTRFNVEVPFATEIQGYF